MKRLIVSLLTIMTVMVGHAGVFKVQGVPRQVEGRSDFNTTPDPIPSEANFDFGSIKAWAGEGANECAVVIQWTEDSEENAMVFGYRWDGSATGEDALIAVVKMHPQLYGAFTLGGAYGATLNGLGWDPDNDGDFSVTTSSNTVIYPDADGLFTASAAGLDNASPTNDTDYFRGGWYDGYWSYWCGNRGDATLEYSQFGMSGRSLSNGCIDAWIFSPDMQRHELKSWKVAEIGGTPSESSHFTVDGISYNLTSETTAEVTAPYGTGDDRYRDFDIKIPATVTHNGQTVTVTSLAKSAFYWASTMYLTLPATIERIGEKALYCNLITLTMLGTEPPACTLSAFIFDGEDIRVYVPDEALEAYKAAPAWKNLNLNPVEYFFADGVYFHVTDADRNIVEACSVQNLPDASYIWYNGDIVIPETATYKGVTYKVEAIGESMFSSTSSPTTITIAASVKKIGRKAINNTSIKQITMLGSVPPVCDPEAFGDGVKKSALVVVPKEALDAYMAADVWKDLRLNSVSVGDVVEVDNVKYRITAQGAENEVAVTFNAIAGPTDHYGNTNYYVGDYTIPATVDIAGTTFDVTAVEEYSFNYASKLGKVELPASVKKIGKYAFQNSSLTEVNIPAPVDSIMDYTFYNCASLTKVSGMAGVTSIGRCAFMSCTQLAELDDFSKVETISGFAFCGDESIVELPEMPCLKTIDSEALSECHSLKYFLIPTSIDASGIGNVLGNRNNGGIVIYSCLPTPTGLRTSNSFAISYSNGKYEFAPVYVPYGSAALYNANWNWKQYELRELTPEVSLDGTSEVANGNDIEFRATLVIAQDENWKDIPAAFLAANDFSKYLADVARGMRLEYREVGSADASSVVASEDNGAAVVSLSNAAAGDYEYRWVSEMEGIDMATDWKVFTIVGGADFYTATFDFENAETLTPAPTESDWVTENYRTLWLCAGTDFRNNGVHMSFTSGNGLAYRSLVMKNAGGLIQLYLYNTLTITAPVGKAIKTVKFCARDNDNIFGYTIANVGLAEGMPGSIASDTSNLPNTTTWTASFADRVSTLEFQSATPTRAIYISRIEVELIDAKIPTGIEEAEVSVDVEYFTIDGIRVERPGKGIYIERRGTSTRKVVL